MGVPVDISVLSWVRQRAPSTIFVEVVWTSRGGMRLCLDIMRRDQHGNVNPLTLGVCGNEGPGMKQEARAADVDSQLQVTQDGQLVGALTVQELKVLQYLQGPAPISQIASALYVSANTVKSHVKSIYGKLGVCSRNDAVERARELKLI